MKFKIYKVLPLVAIMVAQSAAATITTDYYAKSSVLAKGHWVKVTVKKNGMYQITDDELRQMGFSDPEKVAVYGFAATDMSTYNLTSDIPDDLPAVPAMHSNNKLIFYGEADVQPRMIRRTNTNGKYSYPTELRRNYYADFGTYFLTDAMPQVAPEKVEYNDAVTPEKQETFGMSFFEEEVQNPGTIGARFLGTSFADQPSQTYSLEMPGYDGRQSTAFLSVIGIRSDESITTYYTPPTGTRSELSISPVKEDTYAYAGYTTVLVSKFSVNTSGVYNVLYNAAGAAAGGLDYITAAYPRDNTVGNAAQSTLVFPIVDANSNAILVGANENTRFWAFSDTKPAKELEAYRVGDEDGTAYVSITNRYMITDDGGESYYVVAFDPTQTLYSVESAEEVANQDLHSLEAPDMLIITTPLMKEQAERLAAAHRQYDNLDVAVVNINDVYNEFSSGTPHLMAVRRFARMLHDKAPEKFRSILLFGAASYDNRGITATDINEFRQNIIPIYLREDISGAGKLPESYVTDAVVGALDENDTEDFDVGRVLMTVAVSRIPARTVLEAQNIVDKTITYMSTPQTLDLMQRVVAMGDMGDKNGHMSDAEGLTSTITSDSPATTTYKAYASIYPTENGVAANLYKIVVWGLNKGTAFWSYSGHASTTSLSSQKMWNIEKVAGTTYSNPPFSLLMTCRALYYDHDESNLGESLLYCTHGGAINVVGALREVYKEYNQQLNIAIGDEFFSAPYGTTYGEMYRKAHNRMVPTTAPNGAAHYYDVIYNSLSYNIIGDPELRLPIAKDKVVITSVDGQTVTDDATISLPVQKQITVKGNVTDASGAVDSSFSGTITLTVFDGPHSQKTINHDSTSTAESVSFDETLLSTTTVTVTNGVFEVPLYVPTPNYTDSTTRMSLWAVSNDNVTASGALTGMVFDTTNSALEPTDNVGAPEITELYVNNADYANGDIVTSNINLHAEVAPNAYGLVFGSGQPGRKVKVLVDGSRSLTDPDNNFIATADGGGVFDMAVTGLSDGPHTIAFKVFNNAGQSTTRTVNFTIVDLPLEASLVVDSAPATTEATIDITHNSTATPTGRLVVKNAAGQVVYTDENATFPYRWNLADVDNEKVATGLYTVEAYLKGTGNYGYAKPAELVVVAAE
jgi:hypothetical protein